MAKKEIFDVPVVGRLMRWMGHSPVDRSAGAGAIDTAVQLLNDANLVGIFPEGTISRSFEIQGLKTGAVRIAAQAGVPIIPVAIWGSQRIWTKDLPKSLGREPKPVYIRVGAPYTVTGDNPEKDTEFLAEVLRYELDTVRTEYTKEHEHPAGAPWVPAALGGTAPTPTEATKIDERERERRKAQ